jgi:GntR family transcriptional repressor for pyruvate dehydrogenase complex
VDADASNYTHRESQKEASVPDLVLEQPRKVTVVESIVEQIVRQIQTGRLKPGDKLPSERQLIDMLGVGRSSIREALQGLAAIGLVESRAGQGTFVNQNIHLLMPDLEHPGLSANLQREMRLNLIEARRIVELDIVELAAQRATPDNITQLQTLFERYRNAVSARAFPQAARANYDFHLALAQMGQNPFLAPMLDHLLRSVPISLRESEFVQLTDQAVDAIIHKEIDIHAALVAAITAHNAAAARAAMEAHMSLEVEIVHQTFAAVSPSA